MIVRTVLALSDDNTTVIMRNNSLKTIAKGHWYSDEVIDHTYDLVESFTWQDDNTIYIDLKEV